MCIFIKYIDHYLPFSMDGLTLTNMKNITEKKKRQFPIDKCDFIVTIILQQFSNCI